MKQSPLYRLEIAPLVILPLGRSPLFSYLCREPIAPGSFVAMPFGKREIEGIVFGCAALPGRPPHWMKYVSKTLRPEFLTDMQRALASAISEEYFTPLGKTLKHFIPKQAKTRKKKISSLPKTPSLLKATKDDRELLKASEQAPAGIPRALDTSALSDPKRFFALLAKKMISKKKQILILVPEITLIPALEAAFLRFFLREQIAALHSQLADGPFFEAWERIRSGESSVIIATRQGLFAPFRHLGLVIVTEEQDESYKQWDMSPRYDGKRVAQMLARLHTADILLASNTPSIESIYHIRTGTYAPLAPSSPAPALGNRLSIVNLKLERFRKNYSPLSQELIERLRETLAAKQQALLYINRQGMSAFSVCESCKAIFRCKECGRALTGSKEGYFRCLGCGWKTGLFPSCPGCGHLSFRNVGFGTERIEREVARAFPGARIFRVDSSTMRKPEKAQELYDKAVSGKIDIIVGTQMALKDPCLPNLSLIAMIDADSLLSFPDFRADERFFQHLSRAAQQVAASLPHGKVIIQTFHPESTFFQRIAGLDGDAFSEKILAEREALLYPPFSRLLSLACRSTTSEDTEKTALKIFRSLQEILPKESGFRISPPQTPQALKRRDVFESSILIRIPVSIPDIPEALRTFLVQNSKNLIIDVDPISFHR